MEGIDTHCDDAQLASNALTSTILNGEITIDNYRWNSNDYELIFDYDTSSCNEDYKVKMTAVGDFVKAKDGGQKLDGDSVAPNGDHPTDSGNKEWTFED